MPVSRNGTEKSTTVESDHLTKLIEKREERVAKKAAKAKEFKEDVVKGEKKLVAERTPNGLYFLQFKGGGQLPDDLKGKFTSISVIRKRVVARYGKDIVE